MELGLALSGGGIRAAVFHLGVLRRLACGRRLEDIAVVSTVSGGSIVLGAVISEAQMRWPNSEEFLDKIYPQLREMLCSEELFTARSIGLGGLIKYRSRILNRRANVLSGQLQSRWKMTGRLSELPDRPLWWINSTSLETGKNWRFSKREMGDWVFGRHYEPDCLLADAVSASAAVPYVVGALHLKIPKDGWYETDPATRNPLRRKVPSLSTVRLWDGGAYENLGLEPVWKVGRGLIGCDFLICSDASASLPEPSSLSVSKIMSGHLTAPRLFDISSEQIRMLRSRMLMSAILEKKLKAALIRMGTSARDVDIAAGRLKSAVEYDAFQSDQEASLASKHPTNLAALQLDAFDRIARHGFEAADCILCVHNAPDFPKSVTWATL